MKKLFLALILLATPALAETVYVTREDGTIETYQVFEFQRNVNIFKHDKDGIHMNTIHRPASQWNDHQPASSYIPLFEKDNYEPVKLYDDY